VISNSAKYHEPNRFKLTQQSTIQSTFNSQMRQGKYIFIGYTNRKVASIAQTYYGWVWENLLIVVGCLPPEVSHDSNPTRLT
jgi:hypothetical protein